MNNELTLQELLKGKATLIKNKEFYPTKTYIEPFLEKMSAFTDDFRLQAKLPDQITKNSSAEDLTYNRVLIQAVLPEKYCIDKHDEVIGLVYGIDVRKPVVKLYRGYLNQACTNLCVFNPQWLNVQELIPGEPINYSPIKSLLESTNDFAAILSNMKSTYLDREDRQLHLGNWVDKCIKDGISDGFGKVKISPTHAVEAYKKLFVDQESEYFVPDGLQPSMFDIYGAFTQVITDDNRDILQKVNKTLLIGKILEIY